MEREKLEVDIGELCYTYEDAHPENSYFLDMETGGILFFSDDLVRTEGGPERIEEIEDEIGERYITLPRTTPQEGYRDMEKFIETLEDEDLREKLYIAIDGRGAFGRFKNVLKTYPDERERW
ncbi:hypothetical protein AKJ41_04430, partial [candidate division MSBL1 archaeon SCGC-AAA259O05]